MKSLNEVKLLGHVGADPELKYTGKGTPVVNLSVATNVHWFDDDGKPQERTDWHNVSAWGKLAEAVGKYVHKGSRIFVSGSLRCQTYDDRGEQRRKVEIVAADVIFLEGNSTRQ